MRILFLGFYLIVGIAANSFADDWAPLGFDDTPLQWVTIINGQEPPTVKLPDKYYRHYIIDLKAGVTVYIYSFSLCVSYDGKMYLRNDAEFYWEKNHIDDYFGTPEKRKECCPGQDNAKCMSRYVTSPANVAVRRNKEGGYIVDIRDAINDNNEIWGAGENDLNHCDEDNLHRIQTLITPDGEVEAQN